jgi:thiamine biosynthesis lipoprotein
LPHTNSETIAVAKLKDEALSMSAVWGKFFTAEGKVQGHVLDPRTGAPAQTALATAVILPSATETDALSTALLTQGATDFEAFCSLRQGMRALVAWEEDGRLNVKSRGI